jgi:hypothetical protein
MTNKDIIIVLIDDTLDMCDQCIGVSSRNFVTFDGRMAITDGCWLFIKP